MCKAVFSMSKSWRRSLIGEKLSCFEAKPVFYSYFCMSSFIFCRLTHFRLTVVMKKQFLSILLLVALSSVGVNSVAFGQNALPGIISSDNRLSAAPDPEPMPMPAMTTPINSTGHGYFGFDLGLTNTFFLGANNFFWPAYDASDNVSAILAFNSLGSGIGGIFGLKAGFPLSKSIDLEGKLRYITNYASETESQPLPYSGTGASTNVSNTYSMLLSSLDLAAMLHFALSDQWYAAGGLSFSDLLSNRFAASQTLPAGTFYVDDNDNLTNSVSETVPSGSQSNLFNTSRLDVQLGAGTVFPMGSFALDAELLVGIPLTAWLQSSRQAAYDAFADSTNARRTEFGTSNATVAYPTFPNMWYASLTIGLRFPFGGNSNAAPVEEEESTPSSNSAIGNDGKVALTGTVTDANTGNPVRANVTVVDLTNNQVVANDHTDGDGRYNVRVKAPGKYSVTADADGYLFGTSYFEVDDQGRILSRHPNIKLGPASGRTRLLVFFAFGSAELNASSYPELDRAARLMKAVPTMHVEIAGYTDNIGSDDVNMKLSQQRANAVRDYLIQHGVDKSRVSAKGYGKDSPIADNSTDDGRSENRRVEFVVQSK